MVLISCKSRIERNEETLASYPEPVRTHARNFVQWAEDRGIKIKLKNLKVVLTENIKGMEYDGHYDRDEHTVYFDTTKFSYRNSLEEVVFHEFGHAIFKRNHVDKYQGDAQTSFMNSFPQKALSEENRQVKIDEMYDCKNENNFDKNRTVQLCHTTALLNLRSE